jgi:hypothetical protein
MRAVDIKTKGYLEIATQFFSKNSDILNYKPPPVNIA